MNRKQAVLPGVFMGAVFLLSYFAASHPREALMSDKDGKASVKKVMLSPSMDTTIRSEACFAIAVYRKFYIFEYIGAKAWTNKGSPVTNRGLLAFDLSRIPPDAIISRAVLKLYGIGHQRTTKEKDPAYKSNAAYLVRVLTPWDAKTVTWTNQPGTTFDNAIYLERPHSRTQNYFMDVTAFVQGWVAGTYPNHGLMLRLQKEEFFAELKFASKNYIFAAKFPRLEITYSLPN
ncbi:MAG: DNRLRE domain-containing protein [bacterium]|nr:DNRLRE domain-containing protein [bacterium]